jgi:hypothetical protein
MTDDVKHNDALLEWRKIYRHSTRPGRCVARAQWANDWGAFQCSFKGKYPIQTSEGVVHVCGAHKRQFMVMSDD